MNLLERAFTALDGGLRLTRLALIAVGCLGALVAWGWLTCFLARGIAVNGREARLAVHSRDWNQGTARILESTLQERQSPGRHGSVTEWEALIRYEFETGGQAYRGKRIRFADALGSADPGPARSDLARFSAGARVAVWYDPADPTRSTLLCESGPSRTITNVVAGFILFLLVVAGAVAAWVAVR